jgi:hypothetical protein
MNFLVLQDWQVRRSDRQLLAKRGIIYPGRLFFQIHDISETVHARKVPSFCSKLRPFGNTHFERMQELDACACAYFGTGGCARTEF